jgi:hypothetical protein
MQLNDKRHDWIWYFENVRIMQQQTAVIQQNPQKQNDFLLQQTSTEYNLVALWEHLYTVPAPSTALHHQTDKKLTTVFCPPAYFVISDFPVRRDKRLSINEVKLLFDCKTAVCMKLLPISFGALRVEEKKTI